MEIPPTLVWQRSFSLENFPFGFTQQAASVNSFALNNIGLTMGLALENFDFGLHYNFPNRKPGTVFSPSIFELSIIFDFSIYRRNNRGLYKNYKSTTTTSRLLFHKSFFNHPVVIIYLSNITTARVVK